MGSVITCVGFGFSRWFWMAIMFRLLYGFANGNLGVYKTYLGEITDASNQAKAFSFLGMSYGVGSIGLLLLWVLIIE